MFGCAKAVNLDHFDGRPLLVIVPEMGDAHGVIQALLVLDANDFSRCFCEKPVKLYPGYQVTYGTALVPSQIPRSNPTELEGFHELQQDASS